MEETKEYQRSAQEEKPYSNIKMKAIKKEISLSLSPSVLPINIVSQITTADSAYYTYAYQNFPSTEVENTKFHAAMCTQSNTILPKATFQILIKPLSPS